MRCAACAAAKVESYFLRATGVTSRLVRLKNAELTAPDSTARRGVEAAGRLRPAAARKAEGEAHLLHPRGQFRNLLRTGCAHERHHRREPAVHCSNGGLTTQSIAPVFPRRARPGTPARKSRPFRGQRTQGGHPSFSGQAGERYRDPTRAARRPTSRGAWQDGHGPRTSRSGCTVDAATCRRRSARCRRATDIDRPLTSS